jgi:hypothetical protein
MKVKKIKGGFKVTFSKKLFREQVFNSALVLGGCVIAFEAFWYGV